MRSTLKQGMEVGLVVTFEGGEEQFHEVYVNWDGWPLPQPGDQLSCTTHTSGRKVQRLVGTVLPPRRMEICRDDQGQLSLWVRLRATLRQVERAAASDCQRLLPHSSHQKGPLVRKASRNGRK